MAGDRQIQFLSTVAPLIERGDVSAVLRHLAEDWPRRELVSFLSSSIDRVTSLAVQCLGLVGGRDEADAVAAMLRRPSPDIVSRAEDALWSMWMRGGGENARRMLASAMRFVDESEPEAALGLLSDLCRLQPGFAEAHHQRGLVLFGLEAYEAARDALNRALALNSCHFAAAATLGHIAIETGCLADALHHYREALAIHPGLTDIAEILPDLEVAVARRVA